MDPFTFIGLVTSLAGVFWMARQNHVAPGDRSTPTMPDRDERVAKRGGAPESPHASRRRSASTRSGHTHFSKEERQEAARAMRNALSKKKKHP